MLACLAWLTEAAVIKCKLSPAIFHCKARLPEETVSLCIVETSTPPTAQPKEVESPSSKAYHVDEEQASPSPYLDAVHRLQPLRADLVSSVPHPFLISKFTESRGGREEIYRFKCHSEDRRSSSPGKGLSSEAAAQARAKLLIRRKVLKYAMISAKSRGYSLRSIIETPE